MLDIRLLNYVLVVAREQNITKAAAQLHISQPTLSTQISDFEKQFGIKIFKRTNKNTVLTEDGALFCARAQELIELSNKIEAEFSSDSEDISGDLYFGCGETSIMSFISSIFQEIHRQHPKIHFHIYSGDADSVLERLDKGLLDIGLLLGPTFMEPYDYLSLGMYDSFGLLVPGDSEIAKKDFVKVEDLKELPVLISRQTASGTQNLGDFNPEIINPVGSYNLVTNATFLVEQGFGYAFALANLVNTEGRNLKFLPLDREVKIEAFIVTKKYAFLSKAAKLFLRQLSGKLR